MCSLRAETILCANIRFLCASKCTNVFIPVPLDTSQTIWYITVLRVEMKLTVIVCNFLRVPVPEHKDLSAASLLLDSHTHIFKQLTKVMDSFMRKKMQKPKYVYIFGNNFGDLLKYNYVSQAKSPCFYKSPALTQTSNSHLSLS